MLIITRNFIPRPHFYRCCSSLDQHTFCVFISVPKPSNFLSQEPSTSFTLLLRKAQAQPYRVDFFDDSIETLVTHTPSRVRSWIQKIKYVHRFRLHELIVGLDVERRPSFTQGVTNPVATLQLCVGHNCLIFQLCHCDRIPKCLFDFLANPSFTFVGVGVGEDVRKLADDYGLEVANSVDLRVLEARRNEWSRPRSVSLKEMASEVLGQEFQKPKSITLSHWDKPCLSPAQVKYACVDAFVSFEIGRVLSAAED